MNTIDFIVRFITRSDIPQVILENAFLDNRRRMRRAGSALEYALKEKIIIDRIVPDLSRAGGVRRSLQLKNFPYEKLADYQRIYRIPLQATDGRVIVSAYTTMINLSSNFTETIPNQSYQYVNRSVIENSANRVVRNNTPIPNRSNAEVEILEDNVIKINDWQNFTDSMSLVCLLSYSEELTEIRPAYQPVVARLALLATKAYIFQNHRLEMGGARLEGGRDFSMYSEYIDEYRDAYQQYQEYLDGTVMPSLVHNDLERKMVLHQSSGSLTI